MNIPETKLVKLLEEWERMIKVGGEQGILSSREVSVLKSCKEDVEILLEESQHG